MRLRFAVVALGMSLSACTTGELGEDGASTEPFDAVADTSEGPETNDATLDDASADTTVVMDSSVHDAPDAKAAVDTKPDVPLDAGPSSTRQTARPLGSTTAPRGFYEYLPPDYGDGAPHPLLVFWHGIGEDGNGTTDLSKVLAHGPPYVIAHDKWPGTLPFIVLSPQHPGSDCPSASEIHDFLAWAITSYHVDEKRVYLTGLSCGAIGSWSYINANHATQIAAAVLLSGDPGDPTASWSAWGHSGCTLGDVAIWAFHGDMDTVVKIGNEQTTMNDLLACPSPPRRDTHWTVISGGSHDIWEPIYDLSAGYAIYDFLLKNPHP